MSSPVAVIVVVLISTVAIPGLILAAYGFRECWKTDHDPEYSQSVTHIRYSTPADHARKPKRETRLRTG